MIVVLLLLLACGKSKDNGPELNLEASQLIAPLQNAACTDAAIISETTSSVEFRWAKAENAESYVLNLTNLSDGSKISQRTNQPPFSITLNRNAAYSWSVIAKKGSQSVESDVWKFYLSGQGITNYAPFSAEAVLPGLGQKVFISAGKVTLRWAVSDSDNDILNYDVYFGTTTSPAVLNSAYTGTTLDNVPVKNGTNYYWKIVTRDKTGNTSDSPLFYFSTW